MTFYQQLTFLKRINLWRHLVYNRHLLHISRVLHKETHYEILGLSKGASNVEIREAFVTLSKQLHPDTNPADPDNHKKFVRLNEAYTVLSKPLSRQEYDNSLHNFSYQSRPYGSSAGGYPYTQAEGVGWEDPAFVHNRKGEYSNTRDNYYGMKGVKRVPNYVIAGWCWGIILLGFLYFYVGYRYSSIRRKQQMEKDRERIRSVRESQEWARSMGTLKRLEILLETSGSKSRTRKEDSEAHHGADDEKKSSSSGKDTSPDR